MKKAKRRQKLTTGSSIRIAREISHLSLEDLARQLRIPISDLKALENDTKILGLERAKRLAYALGIHPSVLLFPDLNG